MKSLQQRLQRCKPHAILTALPSGRPFRGPACWQFSTQYFRLTAISWLALIGSGLVAISAFFPWWTPTDTTLGITTTATRSLAVPGRFFARAFAVAVITPAWPAFVQIGFTHKCKIGLMVAVAVLTLLVVLLSAMGTQQREVAG